MKLTLNTMPFDTEIYSAAQVREYVDGAKPLFSFSAISDIHLRTGSAINDDNGHDDLVQLFKVLKNRISDKELYLKYIFVAGDIGYSSADAEVETFNAIVKKECPIPAAQVFSCNGNHDGGYTAETWRTQMYDESIRDQVTDQKNFSKVDGDFVFAFMSLASTTVNTDGVTYYLTDETKAWLEDIVAQSAGKTLVLTMHFPIPNRKCADTKNIEIQVYDWVTGGYTTKTVETAETAEPYAGLIDMGGDGDNQYSMVTNHGFYVAAGEQDYSTKTEYEEIVDILNKHKGGKTIVFSGHTHFVFQCEDLTFLTGKGYPNINVCQIPDTNIVTVHIPSLNYPRKFSYSSIGTVSGQETISGSNPYRQPCQSWIVDVHEDKLVLKGFETNTCHDKKYGDILPQYIYTIDLTDYVD